MNETTMHLAMLMGPVLFVLGLSFAVNKDMYVAWRKELKGKNMTLFFMGVVELVAGLAVVLGHNSWTSFSEILVSVMGWGMLIEGLMLLLVADAYVKLASKMLMPSLIKVGGVVALALGAYLTYVSYM